MDEVSGSAQPPAAGDINGFGPRRRSMGRFLLSIGIAGGLVLALYLYQPGWFNTRIITTGAVAPTPSPGPAPSPTPAPKPKPPVYPYIGESHISLADGIKVTVTGVAYTPGDNNHLANKGDVFAIVTLRVDNLKTSDYPFTPNVTCILQSGCNFYVQDGQGEKNPPIPYDPLRTALRAVVLQPRGRQEGSYTFEVPARDRGTGRLVLLWYPNPLGAADTLYHWILTPPPHHGR